MLGYTPAITAPWCTISRAVGLSRSRTSGWSSAVRRGRDVAAAGALRCFEGQAYVRIHRNACPALQCERKANDKSKNRNVRCGDAGDRRRHVRRLGRARKRRTDAGCTASCRPWLVWNPGRIGGCAVQQAAALAAGAPAGETLVLVAKEARTLFVDLPPEGESPGDFGLFEDRVYNDQAERVGADSGRFELSLRTVTIEATVSITGKGKIRIAGSLFNRTDSTFPVTGGTGAYQDVGGQLTVFDLPHGDAALVFHLVR